MTLEQLITEQIVETELNRLIAQRKIYLAHTMQYRIYTALIEYLSHFQGDK